MKLRSVISLAVLLLPSVWYSALADSPQSLASTWPQAYSVQRNNGEGTLTLSVPYYTIQQDLKKGGAISSIRLTHGRAANLLVQPLETRVADATGKVWSDLADCAPRVTTRRDGLNEIVTVKSELRGAANSPSGVHVKTIYAFHWGYVKIHKEITFGDNFRATDICPVSTVLTPALSSLAYRDDLNEQKESAWYFINSCHWGRVDAGGRAIDTSHIFRYAMMADPGVEGIEWFAADDLAQWEAQPDGKHGQGKAVIQACADPAGILFSVSPYRNARSAITPPRQMTFDFYIGLPLLEGHALKPWFHASGDWVSSEQIQHWADSGVQTFEHQIDGDYHNDGLFWRNGSYPPYPPKYMDKFDKMIADCHKSDIRMVTYFSNKELHPSTPQCQQHGAEWGRMINQKGEIQRSPGGSGTNEYGVVMCLRSGWLDNYKECVNRVLSHHQLDGVYYDWSAGLICYNPLHEGLKAGQVAAGHWDIDELINMMEWTRHRVGSNGLIIIHDTSCPMFTSENFASDVVTHEWGYPKWTGNGPDLPNLPLEWSLVNARPRGVISYTIVGDGAPPHFYRLFALEALLSGVTPWPVSAEAEALYPVLKPIGAIEDCRFADWRNQAVTLGGKRFGSAIYSRPGESWIVVGNLDDSTRKVSCIVHPDKLPYPLSSITTATLLPSNGAGAKSLELEAQQLTGSGVTLTIPANMAVLLHVR